MKCKELQVGDWIQDKNGCPMQITSVGKDYACANFDVFREEDNQPEGIPLTKEMLDANGFRYGNDDCGFGMYFRSRIENCDSESLMYYIRVTWVESSEGRKPVSIYCVGWENGENSTVTIRREFYVHTLQHALRLVGLSEIADNFKV